MIVVDCSILIAALLPDEKEDEAQFLWITLGKM